MDQNYEYRYHFSFEDDIISRYPYHTEKPGKCFLLEIETHFIINKRDGQEKIGSETFDCTIHRTSDKKPITKERVKGEFRLLLNHRLYDYGVDAVSLTRFNSDAADFAVVAAANPEYAPRPVIPIHVKFEVVTLQKQGETIEEARDRAVGPDVLTPIRIYPFSSHVRGIVYDIPRCAFLATLRKIRVGDVVGPIVGCDICSRLPNIGTRVTRLPGCKHVFHSHCIVRWLLENNTCPTCKFVVYDKPCQTTSVLNLHSDID